jgi:hypothetical protein
MADRNIIPVNAAGPEGDEVKHALDTLRCLAGRVSSPVIRACPEDAGEEIAHLTGCGDRGQEQGARKAAG